MENQDLISRFLSSAMEDPRIGPNHISLFAGLVTISKERGNENPLCVFSRDLMPLSKLTGPTTYHKTIRDLHNFGYIRYTPSFNHFLGSLVTLTL